MIPSGNKPPRLLKAYVLIENDQGLYLQDAIEYEGKLWLVPQWSDSPILGVRMPTRIISLETIRHQQAPVGYEADLLINDPLPTGLLDGPIPPELAGRYVVIEEPEIEFPLPSNRMN